MNPKQKMIAVLEVEFDPNLMIDEDSLQADYNGDWLRFMKWLFKEDSIGIFDEEIKLVGVKQIIYPAPTKTDKETIDEDCPEHGSSELAKAAFWEKPWTAHWGCKCKKSTTNPDKTTEV